MPRAEKGTPKQIANAMKAKGLQRLRWYCQVCQKQCRDENGFKCHTMSESHLRQMLVVGENAGRHISDFSTQFKVEFLTLLSRRWGTKRVKANIVYQEYITDKHHTHMNSTRWVTLTEFCKWLGREGICHVDETEKGWFIAWIDNSPKTLAKQAAQQKRERGEMDDEERMRRTLAAQIEKAREQEAAEASGSGDAPPVEDEPPVPPIAEEGFKFSFKPKPAAPAPEDEPAPSPEPSASTSAAPATGPTSTAAAAAAPKLSFGVNPLKAPKTNVFKSSALKSALSSSSSSSAAAPPPRPIMAHKSAVESIIAEELERKRKREERTWSAGYGESGLQTKRVRVD